MPVKHIVLLKFKTEISVDTIAGVNKALEDLKTQNLVPGITEYFFGPYDSPEGMNKGFTHGFTMVFVDPAARDTYLPHPEHERVKGMIIPLVDDVVAFDFVI